MVFQISQNSRVILAGKEIDKEEYRKFIESYYMHYGVVCIADDAAVEKGMYLRGLEMIPFNQCRNVSGVIVLFGEHWPELEEQLERYGMVFLRDFLPEWLFELAFKQTTISYSRLWGYVGKRDLEPYFRIINQCKKIAVVYGDGTVPYIVRLLSRVDEFCEDYILVSIPPVAALKREHITIPDYFWKYVSLCIIQKSPDNRRRDEIMGKLPLRCRKMTFPQLIFSGYYPQHMDIEGKISDSDKNIDDRILQGNSMEEIIQELSSEKFYSEDYVKDNLERNFEMAKIQEGGCDVKYSQYLLKEYKNKKLFKKPYQPSYDLVKYLVMEILRALGYERAKLNEKNLEWPNKGDTAVYPSVKKILDLKFSNSDNRENEMADYIMSYIQKKYPDRMI